MEKQKKIKSDELKIINSSIKKLLKLEEQEKKIHRAQKKELDTIQNVWNRYCDDKNLKEKVAKNKEACNLLEQAKLLISELRNLLSGKKASPPYYCGEFFLFSKTRHSEHSEENIVPLFERRLAQLSCVNPKLAQLAEDGGFLTRIVKIPSAKAVSPLIKGNILYT